MLESYHSNMDVFLTKAEDVVTPSTISLKRELLVDPLQRVAT